MLRMERILAKIRTTGSREGASRMRPRFRCQVLLIVFLLMGSLWLAYGGTDLKLIAPSSRPLAPGICGKGMHEVKYAFEPLHDVLYDSVSIKWIEGKGHLLVFANFYL